MKDRIVQRQPGLFVIFFFLVLVLDETELMVQDLFDVVWVKSMYDTGLGERLIEGRSTGHAGHSAAHENIGGLGVTLQNINDEIGRAHV